MKLYTAFIAALLLVQCSQKREPAAVQQPKELPDSLVSSELKLTAEQLRNAAVELDSVRFQQVGRTINLSGSIDVPPQNLVSITCPLGGYLKNIHLLPGEAVRKGQVVALMEDLAYVQLQQDYLVAKSKIEYLRKEYARQKSLAETEAGARKLLEEVTSQLQAERVNEKALSEKLAVIGINAEGLTVEKVSRQVGLRSPINGFVTKVNVNVGRYVNVADVLVELVDPSDIHASLTVYEKDISSIRKDQTVVITPLNQPEKQYQAEVLLVTRNLDENRAGLVHCHFHRYEPELLPGMFINAQVSIGGQLMPAVPESALVRHQGKSYVFIKQDAETFRLTEVQAGETKNGFTAIANSAISWKGKEVVSKNAFTLLSAMFNKGEEE